MVSIGCKSSVFNVFLFYHFIHVTIHLIPAPPPSSSAEIAERLGAWDCGGQAMFGDLEFEIKEGRAVVGL